MKYKSFNLFSGDIHDGDKYRREYADSIEALIESKLEAGKSVREQFMPACELVKNADKYRRKYLEMIGFPFDLMSERVPSVTQEYFGCDDMCKLYRLSIEVTEGFKFYGILMIPHGIDKAPLVIAQHGGGGTPESCSDMYKENNYGFFTKRALERKLVVFAPSLYLWKFERNTGEMFPRFDIPADRGLADMRLRSVGYTITGLEVFCIMRCIDYLITLDCVIPDKIGMIGLSYGGYFSLHTAAADTRIISVYDAASFNDRGRVFIRDWLHYNAVNTFGEAEVAGLVAPRRLRIDVGKTDGVFDYVPSIEEAERIKKYYSAYGATENLDFKLWEGGHRFDESLTGFEFFFDGLK